MYETQIPLGQRNETAQRLNLNEQSDFNCFNAFAFNRFALLECFFNDIPVSQTVYFNLRHINRAVFLNSAYYLNTECISDFQHILEGCRCRVGIFMSLKHSFGLVAKGDVSFVIENFDNLTLNYAAFVYIQVHFLLIQHFLHVFHNTNYLLYDPVRCGCTGGDANLVLTAEPFWF